MRDCLPLIMQRCVSCRGRQVCYLVSRLQAPVQGRVCLAWAGFLACSAPFWCKMAPCKVNDSGLGRLQRACCDPGMLGMPFCSAGVYHRFPQPEECTWQETNPGRPQVAMAKRQEAAGRCWYLSSARPCPGEVLTQAGVMCMSPF